MWVHLHSVAHLHTTDRLKEERGTDLISLLKYWAPLSIRVIHYAEKRKWPVVYFLAPPPIPLSPSPRNPPPISSPPHRLIKLKGSGFVLFIISILLIGYFRIAAAAAESMWGESGDRCCIDGATATFTCCCCCCCCC